jgi:ribosomal protein S18 acetylase RimI-like enzyme
MGRIFRTAGLADYEEVLEVFRSAVGHMRSQDIEQWDEIYPDPKTLLEDIQSGQMYLLAENGRILSAVVLNEDQAEEYLTGDWLYRDRKVAAIHRLCVHPEYQKRGIARETIFTAEQILTEMGYTIIRLDAFVQNPRAVRLYESMGYRHAGQVVFRKGDFYLFEKQL